MFTIRFKTVDFRPDLQVTIRGSAQGFAEDLPGIYENDEWRFELPEQDYPAGMKFKFVLERTYWMLGDDLQLAAPVAGGDYAYDQQQVTFPALTEAVVENGRFQQLFFEPSFDEAHEYDVIVVGSGIGGGTVADQLDDLGLDVLVLEAGSALFPTHSANLPRKHALGEFDKHLWSMFDDFKVVNYVNAPGSTYGGAQAFNLGGRSIFWGGFIPRMTWWELESWPAQTRWHLENTGYQRAEDLMYWPPPPSPYQQQLKSVLATQLADYDHFDAPMAVRQVNNAFGTLSPGLFSTADLLTESRLRIDRAKPQRLTVNLSHAVVKLETAAQRVTGVVAHDLIAGKVRTYRGKRVVLAAGTIESAKLAQLSGLSDPSGLVGVGLTDHPVLFTHFSIAKGKHWHRVDSSSKTLSRHKLASAVAHPYNLLLELGADLNQGRYLDADTLARHRELKGDAMLCEVVFLFNAPLQNENTVKQTGPSYQKPVVAMQESPAANPHFAEVNALKDRLIDLLGGEALPGRTLDLGRGGLGGVAHEVGTLRMGPAGQAVVDENLKFHGYDNLFVCDLSVFPSSPAANPTLTLAALAFRLADHIKQLA